MFWQHKACLVFWTAVLWPGPASPLGTRVPERPSMLGTGITVRLHWAHSKIGDPSECGRFPVGLKMMGFNNYFYKIKLFMLFLHISVEKYT